MILFAYDSFYLFKEQRLNLRVFKSLKTKSNSIILEIQQFLGP